MGKLKLYRKIRNAMLASNSRTDNSIITECNIAMPLANDKGVNVPSKGNVKKRSLVRGRKVSYNRTTEAKRRG